MNTATLAIALFLLLAAIAAAYAHAALRKQRRVALAARRVDQAVTDYFVRSGVQIRVQCHPVHGRFLILVETEPLKRFRYSHIVEASLIEHVEKTLGLHVDRVFWRFPLPIGASSPQDTADHKPFRHDDEYVAAGSREGKLNPDYHVAEDSWDQFEKARRHEPAALDAAGEPGNRGR